MRKAGACILIALLWLWAPPLYAQEAEDPDTGNENENEEEPAIESDWEIYMPELYSRGDQTFNIALGLIFPTVFFNQGEVIDHQFNPRVGGTGSLSYHYFINGQFSLGGEISGMFNYTLGNSTVFIIPIGARLSYQFVIKRFEFPVTWTIGFAPQRYLNLGYFGFYMKGGLSAYFRFSPDWSFGLNSNWAWFPQWTREPAKNVHGNIVDFTLSARYHF